MITIENYINAFSLEEGEPLQCVEMEAVGYTVLWGTWYGRKLVMVKVPRDTDDYIQVAFSLDFAQHDVAEFCRGLDRCGEWRAVDDSFMAIGSAAEENERILWGLKASLYRTFRDGGRIGDQTH